MESWNRWSAAVTKYAKAFVGEVLCDKYVASTEALSTKSLVKEDRGRKDMGEVLEGTD